MKRTDHPRESLASDADLRVNQFGKFDFFCYTNIYLEKKYENKT